MIKKKSTKTAISMEADEVSSTDRKIAALSYVFILFLIPLLGRQNSKFVQFHAKQGLVLFAIEVVTWPFSMIPFIGQLFITLPLIIISVLGIVKTLGGETWEIPYIHNWSKKVTIK
ncbi:MAG: hypothetical protein UT48_C0011G0012 [Parcubacteria group bacterium GW2011_GWE2_39_37]|nr:MAG: hypothetical protein UT48_C0011G0012 [Parcubacteria group bacterium GW2011_GWE2_39_37]